MLWVLQPRGDRHGTFQVFLQGIHFIPFRVASFKYLISPIASPLGQRILPPDAGSLLSTIILSSGLLYEIVGPACAKMAMNKAGVITSAKVQPLLEDDGGILQEVKAEDLPMEEDHTAVQ